MAGDIDPMVESSSIVSRGERRRGALGVVVGRRNLLKRRLRCSSILINDVITSSGKGWYRDVQRRATPSSHSKSGTRKKNGWGVPFPSVLRYFCRHFEMREKILGLADIELSSILN